MGREITFGFAIYVIKYNTYGETNLIRRINTKRNKKLTQTHRLQKELLDE